jgi:hypothetical protein
VDLDDKRLAGRDRRDLTLRLVAIDPEVALDRDNTLSARMDPSSPLTDPNFIVLARLPQLNPARPRPEASA